MAKKFNRRVWSIGAIALILSLTIGAGDAVWAARDMAPRVVEGQVFTGGLGAEQVAEAATPRRVDPAGPIGLEMRLEEFADGPVLEKSEPVKGIGMPLRVGSHRELPAAFQVEMGARDLEWEDAREGGQVAVFSVTSPGAKALRLALDFQRLPRGSEVRFYSPSEPTAAGGSFDAAFLTSERKAGLGDDPFWSPAVHGETAVVEIWVPSWRRASDVRLSVRKVSHIYRSLADKDLRHLGRSGSCNKDIQCFKKWTMAGNAVAKILFEVSGGSALCTGQLMNNAKGKLLFLTASHCVSTRGEAGSIDFFWHFQRASCGGANPTSVMQTGGGAKRLFTSASASRGLVTDHTLLQLKRDPAPGATLLGWAVGADPEDQLRETVHSAHHPAGDTKKGSRGKVQDIWQLQPDGSLATGNPPTHYQVGWKKGTTEGGSSGGPILTGKKWPNQFVIGVLTGGLASCSARRDPDFYGMFEETFRRYKKFRKHFE